MRRLIALPLVFLALVGCGGSAADGDADPAASIPAGALGFVDLAVRPEGERREKMAALAGRFLRTDEPGKRIVELLEKAADERGSYENDVEPWLGERVGVGVFDSGAEEPDFVGAAATTDPDAAREVIEREAKRDGGERATYEDVEYWVDEAGDAIGVTDEVVLFAGSEKLMRQAIDAGSEGGKSLAGDDAFKGALKPLPQDRAGTLYMDTRRLLALEGAGGTKQAQVLGLVGGSVPPIAVAVIAEADHLLFETRSRDRAGSLSWFGTTELVRELPADSIVAAGVPKLGEAARDLVARAGGALGAAVVAQQLEDQYGISLERDVYSWIGDVGIFARGKSTDQLSGGVVIEVLDEDKARQAVTRLLGALRLAAGVESRPVAIAGADRAFELEGLPMRIFVALKGDRAVIALGREALLPGLERSSALGDSPRFERAREVLHGLEPSMVLDWPAALALLSAAARDAPEFNLAKPYLEPIDVVASGAEKKGDEFHSRLAVGVK